MLQVAVVVSGVGEEAAEEACFNFRLFPGRKISRVVLQPCQSGGWDRGGRGGGRGGGPGGRGGARGTSFRTPIFHLPSHLFP